MALRPIQVVLTASSIALPVMVGACLAFLRPDLLSAFVGRLFGEQLLGAAVVLANLGGLAQGLLFWWLESGDRSPRTRTLGTLSIGVGAFLACTLPALVLLVFGPIVAAFMFNTVEQ